MPRGRKERYSKGTLDNGGIEGRYQLCNQGPQDTVDFGRIEQPYRLRLLVTVSRVRYQSMIFSSGQAVLSRENDDCGTRAEDGQNRRGTGTVDAYRLLSSDGYGNIISQNNFTSWNIITLISPA